MALLSALRQFNWIDILFIIIFVRVSYVALKTGFCAELFRLLGTLLAIYLSLHYYADFSDYLISRTGAKNIRPEYPALFSFIALVLLGYISFAFIGNILSRFMRMETAPNLNRWGGFFLGFARSFLAASIILFALVISPGNYLKHSVIDSYSGKRVLEIAPAAYTWMWQSVMSKFRVNEAFNDSAIKVKDTITNK